MTTNETNLTSILTRLGVPDAGEKARLMLGYMDLVLQRNEVMNLTAITGEDEFIERHIADSLAVYGRPELDQARRVADVGTGAGFPGVPLAIACPDKEFLLIDSLRKRTDFIAEACAALGIANVQTLHTRAEVVGRLTPLRRSEIGGLKEDWNSVASRERNAARATLRESFDLVVSRAVGHLSTLCEYALPLLRVGGAFYAYKSESQLHEIKESEKARQILGAAPDIEVFSNALTPVPTPIAEEPASVASSLHEKNLFVAHLILIVRKARPTPAKYPRRPGLPSKTPL
jgi:16S rRNA (guanine527-N7)-methyltransferase